MSRRRIQCAASTTTADAAADADALQLLLDAVLLCGGGMRCADFGRKIYLLNVLLCGGGMRCVTVRIQRLGCWGGVCGSSSSSSSNSSSSSVTRA